MARFYWADLQPTGDENTGWESLSISGDGKCMLACRDRKRLYLSTDGGNTWAEKQPIDDNDYRWIGTAINSDGSVMVAGKELSPFDLRLSTDYGQKWTKILVDQPNGLAISGDGSKILLVRQGGRVKLSIDGGSNWSEPRPYGDANKQWRVAKMSQDGTVLLVSGERVFLSTDTGASWTDLQPTGDEDKTWGSCAMSDDGETIIANTSNGRCYVTLDGGANWAETHPSGTAENKTRFLACSADGGVIMCAVQSGRIYVSYDKTTTWIETRPDGNANKSWMSSVVTPDGHRALSSVNRLFGGIDGYCGVSRARVFGGM